MDNNNNTSNDFLNQSDRNFWEEPDNHVLIKSDHQGIEYFSILILKPFLSISIIEDFQYAQKLSKKMIESGVRVFDNQKDFNDWYTEQENLKEHFL